MSFTKHKVAQIEKLRLKVSSALSFQDKLIAAVNTSHQGIALLNMKGEYIWLNEAHEKMFGYEKGELIGQSWQVLYDDIDAKKFIEEVFPIVDRDGKWSGKAIANHKDKKTKIKECLNLTQLPDGGLICTVLKEE
jgi:PAS domain S-box-containing protein